MSENRKQTAGRTNVKKGAGKSKAAGAKNSSVISPYRDEIILLITLIISILFLLSNFNLCGNIFGPFIKKILFGTFGILAYLVPFALFIGTAFFISNQQSRSAKRKLFSCIGVFFIMTGLLQLIGGFDGADSIMDYWDKSAAERSGGGLAGGLIVKFLCTIFGKPGAYVILIGGLILLFMLITEKLIFAGLGKKSAKTIEQVREKKRAYQEEREAAVERGELSPRKARIFTFDKTNKADQAEKNEEVQTVAGDMPANDIPLTGKKKKGKNMPEAVSGSELPVYEEELLNKFNQNRKSTQVWEPFATEPLMEERMPEPDIIPIEPVFTNPEPEQPPVPELEPVKEASPAVVNFQPVRETGQEPYNKNDRIQSSKIVSEKAEFAQEVHKNITAAQNRSYQHPPYSLLIVPKKSEKCLSDTQLKATALKLQQTLESFGVHVTVTNASCGPTVTRYELQPEQGVKVSRITGLADDIKLNLAAQDIRIEAPIPGKAAVGIEVPNPENSTVMLRELLESREFKTHSSNIAFAVGKDIGGQTVVTDIAKMPHLLIAGATGSGKSVCINTLIMSILYKADPGDVKLIMIDPKVVELSVYNGIPHLLIPVVTDPKKASAALNWAVAEMTARYKKFADFSVRDLKGYNEKVAVLTGEELEQNPKMPQIVIIVDELADLMMVAPGEVEESICRLAQLARAAGIHLIIATQRPSVNVITGVIKANVPSRIAFSVSSAVDSRTIIDGAGAEKLLGKGDMLFFPSGISKPFRVQGAFVSDQEVGNVVDFLKSRNEASSYDHAVAEKITEAAEISETAAPAQDNDRDEYFAEAGRFIIEKDKASIGMLQRVYKIGFNRAARIMDQLCDAGVVGPEEGTKPRKVLMTLEEFEQLP